MLAALYFVQYLDISDLKFLKMCPKLGEKELNLIQIQAQVTEAKPFPNGIRKEVVLDQDAWSPVLADSWTTIGRFAKTMANGVSLTV